MNVLDTMVIFVNCLKFALHEEKFGCHWVLNIIYDTKFVSTLEHWTMDTELSYSYMNLYLIKYLP